MSESALSGSSQAKKPEDTRMQTRMMLEQMGWAWIFQQSTRNGLSCLKMKNEVPSGIGGVPPSPSSSSDSSTMGSSSVTWPASSSGGISPVSYSFSV